MGCCAACLGEILLWRWISFEWHCFATDIAELDRVGDDQCGCCFAANQELGGLSDGRWDAEDTAVPACLRLEDAADTTVMVI